MTKISNHAKGKQTLKDLFPSTSDDLLRILSTMLSFNPYFRPTAKDLLKNKIFDNIRIPSIEEPCPHKIVVNIDRTSPHDDDLTKEEAKESIKEIKLKVVKEFIKL